MLSTILIVVPILYVLFGAVGALSFAMREEQPLGPQHRDVEAPAPTLDFGQTALLFDGPDGWHGADVRLPAHPVSTEELVAYIESDLRRGRRSAEFFARSPSQVTLHIH